MVRALYQAIDRHAPSLLTPLDYLGRAVTEKYDLPPRRLRREVGPLRSFESSGAEFVAYLKVLASLKPNSRLLDIGCGCGMIPIALDSYLADGEYVGMDIQPELVRWCESNLDGDGRFFVADLANRRYNPGGETSAADYQFPFDRQTFTTILLKSVFTHLPPAAVRNYLKEIGRLLEPGGRCLATFFLLNGRGSGPFTLAHGTETFRYDNPEVPEEVCAHDEATVRAWADEAGLSIVDLRCGTWATADGLSFQDIVVFER